MRAAVSAALVGMAAAVLVGQQFRSGIDVVDIGVSVLDRKGNLIADLTHEHFAIYEDGKKQEIQYFARGDATESPAGDLHLGVLFDTSGSMEKDLKDSRTASIKFLNALPEAADITLVDFDTEVRVAKYGQADFPRLVERIRRRPADGWTALYDALGVYLNGAESDDGRKVLVLYSDGGDTRSQTTFSDVMALLKASDVTVYAIGFLEHQSASTKMDQRMRLQQISDVTGGLAFFPMHIDELDKMYEKVVAEIHGQYSLGFVSSNTKADGTWRKVEVKVTRPDLKGLKIRARKGYFAPYRESSK